MSGNLLAIVLGFAELKGEMTGRTAKAPPPETFQLTERYVYDKRKRVRVGWAGKEEEEERKTDSTRSDEIGIPGRV